MGQRTPGWQSFCRPKPKIRPESFNVEANVLRHPLYNLLIDLPRLLKKRAMHVQIIALPARSNGSARREVAPVRLGGARGLWGAFAEGGKMIL
jgi:hypothetical protein